MKSAPYAFYAHYPAILREPLSFIHFVLLMIMTSSVVVAMAIMAAAAFLVPSILGGLVVMTLLRGAGVVP